MKKKYYWFSAAIALAATGLTGCGPEVSAPAQAATEETSAKSTQQRAHENPGKPVIYQVMTRLFGNTNPTNKPWGTIEENGVGKFSDFTPEALAQVHDLGATYIWYTGALHHALVGDYTKYGISNDDPDVVKGRAGSPYAIKDYYSVDPDLADDPAKRQQEFRALIERSHAAGLKVIMDIVPNHVARAYESAAKPGNVHDFGANDDTSVTYARDNNFYYVPGEDFKVPAAEGGYRPLGGESNPLVDGKFDESPAKWTGNGARAAQPAFDDWYETIKLNFGVRPDGSEDFPKLPADYADKDYRAHAAFWADKDVPDTWKKFRDITRYWLGFGVDGFRYDMAGMVPVEFWSYLNSSIKMQNPDAVLIAEIYTPERYRDYIRLGKMDYLYDKVGTYDAIRAVMEGKGSTDQIAAVQQDLQDIAPYLLHFMENHDEQRIASKEFAGSGAAGKPAMLVSATIAASPTLVYFGQELGEKAEGDAGFGKASRTTIFDYWSVPSVRRWIDGGKYDDAQLSADEKQLRSFYRTLLNFSTTSKALRGKYADLHSYNRAHSPNYGDKQFAFARWSGDENLVIVANFADQANSLKLQLPEALLQQWQLSDGKYELNDQLDGAQKATLRVKNGKGEIALQLQPFASHIFRVDS
ncbi:alpha-amylase family protein [Microbulbifer hainanensis]|uniref:alpha-amylase family protein n=1 Tax=Microbulbifer hainanensis TaxID=2735675 RepID=UPI001868E458|nr:alpha-amylase family glycosyl hydrolase [Microbulbifer hainanensis]